MPKYLIQASYTSEGVRGLQKDTATARREAVAKLLQSAGGKMESMHYALWRA